MRYNQKYDILLSYSISDFEHVERIASYLSDIGIAVWFDKWFLVPGQNWQSEIKKAIESSYTIGVFISSSYSGWQHEELIHTLQEQGQEKSIRVIPILLPGVTLDYMPSSMQHLPFIDFRNDILDPNQLISLITTIANAKQSGEGTKEQLIGDGFRKLGNYRKAIFHYKRALEICQQISGADHQDTLELMSNLATTLSRQGDLAGAREIQEQVLEITRKILGSEHPSTSISAWNLFSTVCEIGDSAGAEKVLENDLLWLLNRDPESIGADQQQIREMLTPLTG